MDEALYSPQEVKAAAKWLDQKYPGWAERVDPDTLYMIKGSECVAGQLGLNWETLSREWEEASRSTWGARRGIHATQVFASMVEVWVDQINARVAPV
jgi:hypothetical protein